MDKKVVLWPHNGVYTKLFPSKINKGEVGVAAILPIRKGINPFRGDAAMVSVSEKRLRSLRLPKAILDLYEKFGALVKGRRYAPLNFNLATACWYVQDRPAPNLFNSLTAPNLSYGDDDQFYTNRDIKPGEELTVDYKTIK